LAAIAAVPSRVEEASPLEVEVIELFDQLRDRLLRYLFSFNLPVADCEEVVQETFLALFQHLQKGKSRHNLRGWLFRVAHNLALKRHLRGRRDFQTLADLPAEIQVADPSPGPEAEFVEGEKRRRLQSVYHALPKQDQHCLALRAEGLRYREIADVLEISLGSVAISLERSLARLTRAADQMSFNRNIGESHAK
jgi:RNA polymerase sigma-70 factor (ECF subfamily)